MATLLSLADKTGPLIRLNQPLPNREQPVRSMFFRQEAIDDIGSKIRNAPSDRGLATSPIQELDALLTNYVAGERLMYLSEFHVLHHVDAGVWELKTVDVRMFGWFAAHDHFVCTNVDLKKNVIANRLYPHYRDQAVAFRDSLDLDPPKFVQGDDPVHVISNYTQPH